MAGHGGADRATRGGGTAGAPGAGGADDVLIRPLELDDLSQLAGLMRVVDPLWIANEASLRHRRTSTPARAKREEWVAVQGGRVVGRSFASVRFWSAVEDSGMLDVAVDPAFRRLGIGSRLYDLAEEHLGEVGSRRIWLWFTENADGERFARARGFEPVRVDRLSQIDPRQGSEALPQIEGFRAVPLTSFRESPRDVFDVEAEAMLDVPISEPFEPRYDEWLDDTWRHPLLDFDLSTAVVHDGRLVTVAHVRADREGGRGDNSFTGTLRAFRGRGLAYLAKLRSLHAAAAAGITVITTANDERNAPMLAVNRRLGYAPAASRIEWLREL